MQLKFRRFDIKRHSSHEVEVPGLANGSCKSRSEEFRRHMDLLPFFHMSAALVCRQGTYARGSAQWERRGPPRPAPVSGANGGVGVLTLGSTRRRSTIASSSDWQIFCPLAAEDFLQRENDGFAAALFHQSGYRDLRAFHRLAEFHEVIKCRADL